MESLFGSVTVLAVSLIVILLSCEIFTNAIEWFGKKLNVGEGVVGSIFAAVGTCLPETMVPVIAIFLGGTEGTGVGVGAIAGAPFMLSTLAFFVTGLAVVLYSLGKKRSIKMEVNTKIISRDIGFFITVYSIGVLTSFSNSAAVKVMVAIFLICAYIYYIYLTTKNDSDSGGNIEDLYMAKILKKNTGMGIIVAQLLISLAGIAIGAEFFVEALKQSSHILGVDAMILSLILAPVATELPEKFNSIIWVGKKKDTLALGNITGAMVFQSCIPVTIGILFTPWHLGTAVLLSAVAAILAALMNFIILRVNNRMSPYGLMLSILFYIPVITFALISK